MTLTFRSLGKKFHHSIWGVLTLYVLVLFCLGICFIRWLGVGVQLIILFMILPPRILPPYHMSFSKVLSCLQFCLIGLPLKVTRLGSPILLWHPIALTSHWLWHPFALASLCFDIPDMWHRLCCVIIWIQKWFGPWAAWIWFYDMLRSVTRYGRPCKILNPES